MVMQRWIAGAAALLVAGGVGSRDDVGSILRVGANRVGVTRSTTETSQPKEPRYEAVSLAARSIPAARAGSATLTAEVAPPSSRPAALAESGWEAKSFEDDPANLKGERVRATEADPLPVDVGAAGLTQMLRKLRTRASLLMIVAHPDDEDGGMLTYESRGQGVRVGMLTLTRGEGGQNVMTGDFDDALGLVRTRELLAADRYLGVDQMFGTEVDFGFSKTKEEAFQKWTHDRVLYDTVRAVRLYRPLVVASVFLGAPTDGHGQHQVSGEMAQEVFTAAGDPKVFPEMGLPVWAPVKVYARVPFAQVNEQGMFDYATGKYVPARFYNYVSHTWSNEAPKPSVTIPEGEYSADLGKSYVQFAREGLALQRTQIGSGMRTAPPGRFDVGYTRYGARRGVGVRAQEAGFFDGIDTSLGGIMTLAPSLHGETRTELVKGLGQLDEIVSRVATGISAQQQGRVAPVLADALKLVNNLIQQIEGSGNVEERERYDVLHELRVKRVQINDALILALGLTLQAQSMDGYVVAPAVSLAVPVQVRNRGGDAVQLQGYQVVKSGRLGPVEGIEVKTGLIKAGSQSASWSFDVSEPAEQELASRPIFSRRSVEQPYYEISDPRLRNAALPVPAAQVFATVEYSGITVQLGRVAAGQRTGDGSLQPVLFEPGLSVSMSPVAGVVPLSEASFPLVVRVKSAERGGTKGLVQLEMPGGWRSEPNSVEFTMTKAGEELALPFRVTPGPLGERAYTLTALALSRRNGKEYREGYREVGYPGLVRDNLYSPATYRTRGVEVKVPQGLRVAYLPGTGDAVAASLGDIGIQTTTVSVADVREGRLKNFDAVVLGVRAYDSQMELPTVTAKLVEFAEKGGVVVVQYQGGGFQSRDAPYPLSLGNAAEKVVEEDSRVQLLTPAAQVLSWPNAISEKDFAGWVEERGHGFMQEWDSRYEAVTEAHDAGQNPQKGGLLVARVGKGAYVYCAYALYRQMPEGVPGAFRLVANMVSLGKSP